MGCEEKVQETQDTEENKEAQDVTDAPNDEATEEAKAKAAELIARVGLPETVLDRYPTMLSGGEQQRVAIARALGMDTRIILADEPTGNLDSANSENIFRILQGLAHEENYCIVIVTHDLNLAQEADKIIELHDGMLPDCGGAV